MKLLQSRKGLEGSRSLRKFMLPSATQGEVILEAVKVVEGSKVHFRDHEYQ